MNKTILKIEHFKVTFRQYAQGTKRRDLEVIHDISLDIAEGEIVAIIGASGSGKSLLAHGILGILPSNAITEGKMIYKGELLDQKRKEKLRGNEISLIPQSVSYLDPMQRAVDQINGQMKKDKKSAKKILKNLELDHHAARKYPFQLSGGMARRVLISTALASGSKLIIADEPTPGMHETVIQETLQSFKKIVQDGSSLIMITHDIDLAFQIADRIAVFCDGKVVSIEQTINFLKYPGRLKHPYSRALWHALPQNGFYAELGKRYKEDMVESEETKKSIQMFEAGEEQWD